jgi:hypothetical protein
MIMLMGFLYGDSGDESLQSGAFRTVFRRRKKEVAEREKQCLKRIRENTEVLQLSTYFNILHPRPSGPVRINDTADLDQTGAASTLLSPA